MKSERAQFFSQLLGGVVSEPITDPRSNPDSNKPEQYVAENLQTAPQNFWQQVEQVQVEVSKN